MKESDPELSCDYIKDETMVIKGRDSGSKT